MNIDIRTIILILGLTHLMQVVVFIYQYKANKAYKGIGWWLMWSAAELIGFIFLLLRDIPSIFPFVVFIQNTAIVSGTIFIYIGVMRFFDMKENQKIIIPVVLFYLLAFFYLSFVNNDILIRSVILNAVLAGISYFTAIALYKNKTRSINATVNFNAAIFILHGSIFLYRTVMMLSGISLTDIFAPTIFNILPYFDAIIVSLLWTFGFIIMVNQRLNAEMTEAKEHFEQIFNTSPDASLITRMDDGMIIDINGGFTTLSGHSRGESIGKSSLEVNIWKYPEDRKNFISELRKNGFCDNYEAIFQKKNGTELIGLVSAKLISLQGKAHLISVTRDITGRKQAETEIKLKNEELKKINAEKDKFFSIIAHDLRSPFNGFLGLTEIMAEELQSMAPEEIQEIAVTMRNSANNLYSLLENLLEWSRMQRGLVSFEPQLFLLKPKITESMVLIMEAADKKEIAIKYDIHEDLSVFADANMLEGIIRNLVSNAVKFTNKGGVVNVSAKSIPDNSVEISIKDSGIGMNKDITDNLFRLDIDTSRKGTEDESSTGLGLIICKDFIEKHGGKLRVESEEGNGSIFTFSIPSTNKP